MASDQGPAEADRPAERRWRPTESAAALILLLAFRHYGYYHFPQAMRGDIFGAAGAVCIIALLVMLKPWWPLMLWACAEELLVAGCSLWWAIAPQAWADEQCSAKIGFRLGAFGLVGLSMVVYKLATVRVDTSQKIGADGK